MTTSRDMDDHERTAEAAAWFVRLQDEASTADDWLAFERWLETAPANAVAYDRIEALWVELDDLSEPLAKTLRRSRPPRPMWRWPAAGAALAAGIAAAVVIGLRGQEPTPTIYQTPAGQIRQVALADGTVVRLNADSRIAVVIEAGERRVQMADGEAAFDVAHDPSRPFVIRVGDSRIRVVGTEFDVRHRGGELRLTVRRGIVAFRSATGPTAPISLTVGEQLTHRDGQTDDRVARVDPDPAFGWTVDQLVYHDRPLSEVATDLSRRFGTRIRPADAATGRIRFTGVLVTDDEGAVLRRLEAFSGVTAQRTTRGVVLRSHEPNR